MARGPRWFDTASRDHAAQLAPFKEPLTSYAQVGVSLEAYEHCGVDLDATKKPVGKLMYTYWLLDKAVEVVKVTTAAAFVVPGVLTGRLRGLVVTALPMPAITA